MSARSTIARKPKAAEKPYHRGDLRRSFMDAALRLIEERGVSGWALRETARRLGVSHAAPYHHFPDKETLLCAIGIEGFQSLVARQRAACVGLEDPVARIKALGVAYVMFAIENPGHFAVMHRQEVHQFARANPALLGELQEVAALSIGMLVGAVTECQSAKRIAEGDPMEIAIACWSMTYGLSMLWVQGPLCGETFPVYTIERLADSVTDVLVRAFSLRS